MIAALIVLISSISGVFAITQPIATQKGKRISIYDPISAKLVEYLPVVKYFDGRNMEPEFCDQVIYRTYKGGFYKRIFEGPINASWYGLNGIDDDPIKVYNSLLKAWNYALSSKTDLYIPSGVYNTGNRNFPFRVSEVSSVKGLLDCQNITIYGDGEKTILKTISDNGADVLQLNKLKNLKIRNLSITAEVKSLNRSGTNGISITNGFDNIMIDQITVKNLRGVSRNGNLDGGKALTVQISTGSDFYCGKIVATGIKSINCLYGFTCDGCISDVIKKNIDISVDISVENSYLGLSVTNSAPYENGDINNMENHPKIKLVANTLNCQKDLMISRGIGVKVVLNINTTKNRSGLIKSFDGTPWYNKDLRVWGAYFNYIKDGEITIKGNKNDCDYKVAIGAIGAVKDSFNLMNRTENCSFNIDITGKSRISDFQVIEYQGESIHNSVLDFSKRTFSDNDLQRPVQKVKAGKLNKLNFY